MTILHNNIHLSSLWESEKYHRMNVGFLEVECAKHCKTIVTAPHICYDQSSVVLWTLESSVDVYVASQTLHCLITAFLGQGSFQAPRRLGSLSQSHLSHLNWRVQILQVGRSWILLQGAMQWVIGSHQNYTDYLTYLTFVPCTAFTCIYHAFILTYNI